MIFDIMMRRSLLCLSFMIISCVHLVSSLFGYTHKYNTHEDPAVPHTNRNLAPYTSPEEKWIEQPLDHFDPQNSQVWNMRYFELSRHYQPGGPILIYLGGEWPISPVSINQGTLIYDISRLYNGTLFYTEHRYYGKSHPTANTSTANLKYLMVDQALADVAVFINAVKASSDDYVNSSVILAGGSYSASMVAWMRLKYPHLVDGVWASSAPLHAEVDFFQYKEVMTRSIIKVGGQRCGRLIENAFNLIEIEVKANRNSRLNSVFNLCHSLDFKVDAAHLYYELSDVVAGLVQAHRLGDIERACDFMKNSAVIEGNDDLDGFAAWIKHNKKSCIDMSYQNSVKKFSNTEWGSEANRQMRQWIYQTCSEFAWFQTSTSPNQIFGSTKSYPVEYFVQLCNDLYDQSFNLTTIEQSVRRTNIVYGSLNRHLTNIYFTHGELDPWHVNGMMESLNKDATVTVIPMSAHVSDLGSIADYDSLDMKASKRKLIALVGQWLGKKSEKKRRKWKSSERRKPEKE